MTNKYLVLSLFISTLGLFSCGSNYNKEIIPTIGFKNLKFAKLKRSEYEVLGRTTGVGQAVIDSYFIFPAHNLIAGGSNYGKIKIWGWGGGDLKDAIKYAKMIALYNAVNKMNKTDVVLEPRYKININTDKDGKTQVTAQVWGKAIRIKKDSELGSLPSRSTRSQRRLTPTRTTRTISKSNHRQLTRSKNMLLSNRCNDANYKACAKLAYRYYRGIGGIKNIPKATTLFQKACKGGMKKACKFYNRLINPY